MKYKVGDKVVIRKDLKVGKFYGDIYWLEHKEDLKSKDYVVVSRVDKNNNYISVENDSYDITDEMIEGFYKEEVI